jgi:hypothetical protein
MANPQTRFEYPRNDDLEAAPPDDGGHEGSYTRPQDMLIAPENTGERVGAPMLQYTNDFPKERTRAPMTGLVAIIAALVLGLLLAFWVTW